MARKKPISGKQMKEKKRAIKRGGIEKPPASHAGPNREKASNEPLQRLIDPNKTHFDIDVVHQQGSDDLATPKRPKWRYEMSKEEVERNEEAMFEKWRAEMEEKIDS
ncbi:hypothetical protein FRC04_010425 [Tulasnella sp. 424]|nr:hypothetical protein FRC04_010425 [Tulasnella sp. 424]